MNPYISKEIDEIAGRVKNTPQLKKIAHLVEVHSGKQAETLLKA
jgi:hypothetical protein